MNVSFGCCGNDGPQKFAGSQASFKGQRFGNEYDMEFGANRVKFGHEDVEFGRNVRFGNYDDAEMEFGSRRLNLKG